MRNAERYSLIFTRNDSDSSWIKPHGATVAGLKGAAAENPEDVAHLAAWTLVGRAMLNLDEAISKE